MIMIIADAAVLFRWGHGHFDITGWGLFVVFIIVMFLSDIGRPRR